MIQVAAGFCSFHAYTGYEMYAAFDIGSRKRKVDRTETS
jgi:hypothetical protein